MTSMLAALRKKLPGRNASIFWATVLGTTGFYQYNKREGKKRLDYYCKRAEMVANEAIGALDTPRKVHVYVAVPMGELGTRKARLHWERYILPVFVAGALDYELTLVNDTVTDSDGGGERVVRGGIHSLVAEEIKERRRKEMEEDNEELRLWRAAIDERKKENKERERRNKVGASGGSGQELDIANWKPEPYPGIMDIVAIGRETWVEAINGISDGAVGSLNYTIPPLVPLDSEEKEKKDNAAERKISTDTAVAPTSPGSSHDEESADKTELQITDTTGSVSGAGAAGESVVEAPQPQPITVNYDRYTNEESNKTALSRMIPAVAYISHMNITGWSNIPLRVWNFFHNQQNVDLYAQQALQVVFESTKRAVHGTEELASMGKAEEETAGWEGQERIDVVVDPAVADGLQLYDTQNDTALRLSDEEQK
ncbi:mitochondrial import inner membrane translocase subunit tim54 [Coemansia sp. RSA 1813]|nr:mitochondrial import inner membrane translocase subunit tim54 [Coemansia sp. RSA 1646]KAJ1769944.1 mitochondrial import inner membrane translocase subunit tim54 [Coemansia sp. RSA 1843]KAJ2087855.1 mitochondrial import inner membrane translocase subunit tim54 [Coemansia sp. RSA 986]KAJ2212747.1 mitochondrial import inner membrane translocase subunit tim54 [Coemansia sp. RSA 487]KAJ2567486.1 mitochondrial import inner membrane translocase subunit tim54 [Coemansia sp. RSA 1813]